MKIATRNLVGLVAISAFALHSVPATAEMVDATQASFQYGLGQAGITTANGRDLDANALDGSTSTFRSLGLKGSAVFGFGTAFSGPVTIWETTNGACTDPSGSGICNQWKEQVRVYAGNSWDSNFAELDLTPGGGWTELGQLGNFDARNGGTLNASGVFRYLLLVDLGLRPQNLNFTEDGFDVAKVSVSAVPIPAAGWLFGSALIGLAAVSRRKKVRSEKHREA